MNKLPSPNRATLEKVAIRLKPMLPDLVFVGGQVAELLITDPAAIRVRPTKWDAFLGRGEGDLLGSHDLEDIITVVAGRPEVSAELNREKAELRQWLANKSREFLDDPQSVYALQGALPDVRDLLDLISEIRARFERIASGP